MKSKIYLLSFLIVFKGLVFTNFLNASEIPVIVIAPSKKAQSISTVGSSVVVLDEEFIENSNEFFLGDLLSSNTTSTNFFQSGGLTVPG